MGRARRTLFLLALPLFAACRDGGDRHSIALAFGEPAPASLIASWDRAIGPDGQALPPGSGDAKSGEGLYARHCQACHGVGGMGGPAGDLVGGEGSLGGLAPNRTIGSYWPYATTLFDYVRRAMPYDRPGSLRDDEVYALVAYLLAQNGVIEGERMMDAQSLSAVVMPNRDGFPSSAP